MEINEMKNNIETFIFVHDQEIILNYEKNKKFVSLPDLKYVFLGLCDTSLLGNYDNIIYAKDLEYNLEKYPKMCAYSGWYVLYKNNLINKEYVNLFEYDINLCDNFLDVFIDNIEKEIDFYGYVPFSVNHCFLDNPIWAGKLNDFYPDLQNMIHNKRIEKNITEWSTTSNVTMKNSFFKKYMFDNEKLFQWIKEYPTVGHELERNLSVYQIINNNINVKYLRGVISHFQLDSHKTQGLFNIDNYNKIIK